MHAFIKLVLCVGIAMFAAVLVWANSGPRAHAQEPACQFNLLDAKLGLMASETPHVLLVWNDRDHFVAMLESAFGFNFPEVTNVLIAQLQGGVYYGLEIGGCLTPPALLGPLPAMRQSGATPAGVFA